MGVTLEVDESDLRTAIEALLYDVQVAILTDLLNAIERNILSMDLTGTTNELFNNIHIDFETMTIYINAGHAGYNEFGTVGEVEVPVDPYAGTDLAGPVKSPGRQGPPPKEAIEPWVRKKVLEAHTRLEERKRKRKLKRDESDEVVDKIQWHIFWRGTKPKPFTRNAIDEIQNKYNNVTITLEVAA